MGVALQMIDNLLPVSSKDITVSTMKALIDLAENKIQNI